MKPHLFFAELVGLYGVGLAAASVAAATAIAARDHVDRGHGVPFSPKKDEVDNKSKVIDSLIQYHSHIDICQYILLNMATTEITAPEITTAELAQQLKALGDETRLNLLLKIAGAQCVDGACICDLTPDTNLAQSTVSHHMKLLVDAGLLNRSQKGKWAYFSLTPAATNILLALNLGPVSSSDSCCTD